MEINTDFYHDIDMDIKHDIDIETKKEISQETSNSYTAVTDVDQFLNSRNIVSITNQPNNAAILRKNILFRSRKKRKKKKKPSNFAFNFPTPSTAPQPTVSTSIGVKRLQSSLDSSMSNNEITKKLKTFDERIQAIDHHLTRAIVSTNMSLGLEQLTLFRSAISKEIDKIVDGSVPKFYDSYIKFGAIVVKCVDEASLYWLSMQIVNISLWPQTKLKMITFNELQRYFRACVWIPGPFETTETVLKRLERQNPGLNTASWQILVENLGVSEDGRSIFLGVPKLDFKKLEASNFKAYLGLGQINFVFSNIN